MRLFSNYNFKLTGSKFMAVADATAMNFIPEYWMGFKNAFLYCAVMLMIVKQFLHY